VQSVLEPSSRRRPGSSFFRRKPRGSAPSTRSQPTSAPARLGPGLRRGDGGWLAAAICALTLAAPTQAAEPTPYQRALAAGYKAAFLCSGIFNAGRTQAQIEALELTGIYPEYQALVSSLPAFVHRGTATVEVRFDVNMQPRRAIWRPHHGCVTLPIGSPPPARPVTFIGDELPAIDKRPWPEGNEIPSSKAASQFATLSAAALKGSSYGEGSRTTGLIVVLKGQIAAEDYADGFDRFASNRTWSVAKSISGTLVGIAVKQGLLDPLTPARIPEWYSAFPIARVQDISGPNRFVDRADYGPEPRGGITLDNLLRMSSGLHSDTAGNRTDALYMGATTVTQETVHWPLEVPPGSRFRYANNDTLLAVRSLRAALNDDQRYITSRTQNSSTRSGCGTPSRRPIGRGTSSSPPRCGRRRGISPGWGCSGSTTGSGRASASCPKAGSST
jgi:hypothetical protein